MEKTLSRNLVFIDIIRKHVNGYFFVVDIFLMNRHSCGEVHPAGFYPTFKAHIGLTGPASMG
jgi:hypothetical protein